MIDHVLVMNLKRREDKWYFLLGALRAMNFPFSGGNTPWGDIIIRYLSHDGKDYPDAAAVHRAAVADGFSYFDNFHNRTPAVTAWWWTWASALRTIAEMDKTVLLLIDDFIPQFGWSWNRLRQLVEECRQLKGTGHGDFRGLQLRANIAGSLRTIDEPYTSLLAKGFLGNDNAIVLNRAGALLLLEDHAEPPYWAPDRKLEDLARRGAKDDTYYKGLWHAIDPIFRAGYFPWESNIACKR